MHETFVELSVFGVLLGLACFTHWLVEWIDEQRHKMERDEAKMRRWLHKHTPRFIMFICGGLCSPTTIHTLREYIVEVVTRVLRGH